MQIFKKLLSGKRSSTSEGRGSTAITKENLAKLQASLEPQDADDDGATGDENGRRRRLGKRIIKAFRKMRSGLHLSKKNPPRTDIDPPSRTGSSDPPPTSAPEPTPASDPPTTPAPPAATLPPIKRTARRPRFSSAASTVSSTATMSDLPGAGRAIGNLYSRGGRALERMMANIAHRWGYGPHAAYLRMMNIVEHACLEVDDYSYGGNVGWGMSRSRGYLTDLGRSWDRLVSYTWRGTLQTRVTALRNLIKLYLDWNSILYLDDYQPFGRGFASCVRSIRPTAIRDGSNIEDEENPDDDDPEAENDEQIQALAEVVEISFGPKRQKLTECLNDIRDQCNPMLSEDGDLIDTKFDHGSAYELLRPLLKQISKLCRHASTEEHLWIQCRDWILDQHLICVSEESVTPRDLLDDVFSKYRRRQQAKIEHRQREEQRQREEFQKAYQTYLSATRTARSSHRRSRGHDHVPFS